MLAQSLAFLIVFVPLISGFSKFDNFGDNILQELINRYGNNMKEPSENDYEPINRQSNDDISRVAKNYGNKFQTRMDDLLLAREPSIRDQEYLEHSSLWGHQYMQGGAGEGKQTLKPDGSVKNIQVVKTDAVLPAYCNPPNPCPLGYTSEDGCIQDFVNSASFSRDYQSSQECMCDNEHMFDCPGTTNENQLDAIARSIQNHALNENELDKIVDNISIDQKHKIVAKKYHTKRMSPYLKGEKLPVVAKKSPNPSLI